MPLIGDLTLSFSQIITRSLDGKLPGKKKFSLLPGIEFTTFWGHFTSFGITEYIEWDKINPDRGIREVSGLVHSQEGSSA